MGRKLAADAAIDIIYLYSLYMETPSSCSHQRVITIVGDKGRQCDQPKVAGRLILNGSSLR